MRLPPSTSLLQLRTVRLSILCHTATRYYAVASHSVKPPEPDFAPYQPAPRSHLLTLDLEAQTIGKILERQSYLSLGQSSKLDLIGDGVRESVEDNKMRINPGDYVRIKGVGSATDGVAAAVIADRAILVTLANGEMTIVATRKVMLHLPGAFNPNDAKNTVRWSEDEDWAGPLAARLHLVAKLRDFRNSINRAQYWLLETHWSAIQEHFQSPTRPPWSVVTIDDVCQFVSKRDSDPPYPASAIRVAVLVTLMSDHEYFALQTNNDTFNVVPPPYIDLCREVGSWIEGKDPRFKRFLTKIKTLLERNEKIGPPTPAVTPMKRIIFKDVTFNESDTKILKFIGHSVSRTRFDQDNPYAVGLNILAGSLNRAHDGTTQFAVELLKAAGVTPSWGDPFLEDRAAFRWASEDQRIIDAEAKRTIATHTTLPGGQLPIYHDGVDAQRHDWAETEAYIIDDQSAHELDDGLSIEAATDGSDTHWVHIHVADPTAIVRPDSKIARVAKERASTLYLNDRTMPLLPPAVTAVCSLGNKGPQPIMTFSGKIDLDGDLVDWTVRPAILRQSRVLTYDSVDEALGQETPSKTLLDVWGQVTDLQPPVKPEIPDHVVPSLRLLSTVAQRLLERRVRHDAHLIEYLVQAETQIHSTPLPYYKFPPLHPAHFPHIPITTLYSQDDQSSKSGHIVNARHVVAEYMVLAGVIAARFAKQRNTPLVYRAVQVFGLDKLSEARDPKTGQVPWNPSVMNVDAEARYTTKPDKNPFLGLGSDAYARTTSPLRRYCDMVNHWLMKSALDPSAPAVPSGGLNRIAEELTVVERGNLRRMRSDDRYWRTFALEQALKKDPSRLRQLKGLVIEDFPRLDQEGGQRDWHIGIHIPSLAVDGRLTGLTREGGEILKAGDSVDVDLVGVTVGGEGVCTFLESERPHFTPDGTLP